MSKPTIFQTGEIRIEFESANSIKIVRQDNGQAVEMSMSEWNFLVRVAEIANWPTVSPDAVQKILDEANGN